MATVTLYTKPGCTLCDDAREVLERVRTRSPFDLETVDISGDAQLHDRYRERIPVIALDGAELFDYHVDEAELERRLA